MSKAHVCFHTPASANGAAVNTGVRGPGAPFLGGVGTRHSAVPPGAARTWVCPDGVTLREPGRGETDTARSHSRVEFKGRLTDAGRRWGLRRWGVGKRGDAGGAERSGWRTARAGLSRSQGADDERGRVTGLKVAGATDSPHEEEVVAVQEPSRSRPGAVGRGPSGVTLRHEGESDQHAPPLRLTRRPLSVRLNKAE